PGRAPPWPFAFPAAPGPAPWRARRLSRLSPPVRPGQPASGATGPPCCRPKRGPPGRRRGRLAPAAGRTARSGTRRHGASARAGADSRRWWTWTWGPRSVIDVVADEDLEARNALPAREVAAAEPGAQPGRIVRVFPAHVREAIAQSQLSPRRA